MGIEVALLGCVHPHVGDVLGVIASEPDLRLAAAWDSDRSLVPGPISGYAVSDPATAISRADAVVICAPTHERPALCARAAQAGRPILVEAPIARTATDGRRLAHELARSRTPALATLFLRELPALARLRDMLRTGHLGRVSGVHAGFARAAAVDGVLFDAARRMRGREGPGGFVDLAIHLIDALAFLGDVPRLHAVSLDRVSGGRDLGGAAVGRWGPAPLVVRASRATRDGVIRVAVDGDRISAVLTEGTVELRDGSGRPERWIGSPPDAGEAMRAFAARLRRRSFPRDGLAGAIRAQEVLERAERTD